MVEPQKVRAVYVLLLLDVGCDAHNAGGGQPREPAGADLRYGLHVLRVLGLRHLRRFDHADLFPVRRAQARLRRRHGAGSHVSEEDRGRRRVGSTAGSHQGPLPAPLPAPADTCQGAEHAQLLATIARLPIEVRTATGAFEQTRDLVGFAYQGGGPRERDVRDPRCASGSVVVQEGPPSGGLLGVDVRAACHRRWPAATGRR
mmetsp:Transcript_6108/g.17658  ORF Transcript_6108/g.17658 Transcript_6108/m.17658 type:complete len:202 (+) Transcript_6108:1452-2057(+)